MSSASDATLAIRVNGANPTLPVQMDLPDEADLVMLPVNKYDQRLTQTKATRVYTFREKFALNFVSFHIRRLIGRVVPSLKPSKEERTLYLEHSAFHAQVEKIEKAYKSYQEAAEKVAKSKEHVDVNPKNGKYVYTPAYQKLKTAEFDQAKVLSDSYKQLINMASDQANRLTNQGHDKAVGEKIDLLNRDRRKELHTLINTDTLRTIYLVQAQLAVQEKNGENLDFSVNRSIEFIGSLDPIANEFAYARGTDEVPLADLGAGLLMTPTMLPETILDILEKLDQCEKPEYAQEVMKGFVGKLAELVNQDKPITEQDITRLNVPGIDPLALADRLIRLQGIRKALNDGGAEIAQMTTTGEATAQAIADDASSMAAARDFLFHDFVEFLPLNLQGLPEGEPFTTIANNVTEIRRVYSELTALKERNKAAEDTLAGQVKIASDDLQAQRRLKDGHDKVKAAAKAELARLNDEADVLKADIDEFRAKADRSGFVKTRREDVKAGLKQGGLAVYEQALTQNGTAAAVEVQKIKTETAQAQATQRAILQAEQNLEGLESRFRQLHQDNSNAAATLLNQAVKIRDKTVQITGEQLLRFATVQGIADKGAVANQLAIVRDISQRLISNRQKQAVGTGVAAKRAEMAEVQAGLPRGATYDAATKRIIFTAEQVFDSNTLRALSGSIQGQYRDVASRTKKIYEGFSEQSTRNAVAGQITLNRGKTPTVREQEALIGRASAPSPADFAVAQRQRQAPKAVLERAASSDDLSEEATVIKDSEEV